jgi:hypothetical protein
MENKTSKEARKEERKNDSGQEIKTNQQPEDMSCNAGKAYTEHGT